MEMWERQASAEAKRMLPKKPQATPEWAGLGGSEGRGTVFIQIYLRQACSSEWRESEGSEGRVKGVKGEAPFLSRST